MKSQFPTAIWLAVLLVFCAASAGSAVARQHGASPEVLVYLHGSGESMADSVRAHSDVIDVAAPQAYGVGRDGLIRGSVSSALMAVTRETGIRLMPLIHNPGFNQEELHGLLDDPAARTRVVDSLVATGRRGGFWGWQFDFENFHISYRDSMTVFYAEAAQALRAAGMVLSIAVVPSDGSAGDSPFARYMQENWRDAFDVAALDSLGDFISLMTYAQHGAATAPGPIAGVPWVTTMLDHALASGADPGRLSFGLPFYSGYWSAYHSEETGPRPRGREVGWSFVRENLDTEPVWLPEQGVLMAYQQSEGTFEWFFIESARALQAKLDLAKRYPAFRGLSIWVLGAEDPAVWSVLRDWKNRQAEAR